MKNQKAEMQKKQSSRNLKRLATLQDYKDVFNSESGKRVLNDLMLTHKVVSSTVIFNQTTGTVDPYLTVHREGERSVVLRIMDLLKLDLNKFKEKMELAEKHAQENGFL